MSESLSLFVRCAVYRQRNKAFIIKWDTSFLLTFVVDTLVYQGIGISRALQLIERYGTMEKVFAGIQSDLEFQEFVQSYSVRQGYCCAVSQGCLPFLFTG